MTRQNLITLSRSELYELVWSKPVRDVAKDFGMSDVALAKRCRAVRVPIRTRLLGQSGCRPKAKKDAAAEAPLRQIRRHRTRIAGRRTHGDLHTPTPGLAVHAPTPISHEEAALRTRIDTLEIAPLDSLLQAHPAVLRTAVKLKHLKSGDITWPRGTRSGPILTVTNVSDAQIERALRVLDAVLCACDAMNWRFECSTAKRAADVPRSRHLGTDAGGTTDRWLPPRGRRAVATQDRRTSAPVRPRPHRHRDRRQEGRTLRLGTALRLRAIRRTAPAPVRRRQPLGAQDLEGHQSAPARNSSKQDPARPARPRARTQARPRGATPARPRPARARATAVARPSTPRHQRRAHRGTRTSVRCVASCPVLRRYLRAARRDSGPSVTR